jgi:hypothetical protein
VLAEHRAQGCLRDLGGRGHEVLDVHDRGLGIDDAEVGDRVDARGDVVLRDHFLRRDVEGDGAEVDLDDPVDDRDQEDDPGAFRRLEQPAEAEDDAAFVLAEDSDEHG